MHAPVLVGRLPMAQALVLTRLAGVIDPAGLAEAEPSLVLVALDRDPPELARWVAHQIATWCGPQFDADDRSQHDKRYLQVWREADGMLSGRFRLTAADSEAFLTVLELLARHQALADVGRRAAPGRCAGRGVRAGRVLRELPDAGGFRPQVPYVDGAAWAAGATDPAGSTGPAGGPVATFGELVAESLAGPFGDDPTGRVGLTLPCAGAWSGPQTRSTIETILCDPRLTPVPLCERGQVTGLEALGESITATQRRALAARNLGCAVRGCTRPPAFCDAHHLNHRADGGLAELGKPAWVGPVHERRQDHVAPASERAAADE
ncbi:MAG: hypothetical protein JWN08_217 [Frankiales bacterium]|nr:hypothetical protein [Frankiales bacterium]